jgi:hypothetical protein
MFTLTITTDNAAFEEDARGEVARILRTAAAAIEAGRDTARLRDANGNTVGSFDLDVRAADGDGATGRD